ncbi:hypothetical protein CC1G_14423 [Coprinopsis cinerea okayama7|uniref:Uncharacterized protein n=1 Tax=Coprinopsis cinerea (strain Okayama-7 / 130 / ATCC MYA-4618 / FGSC 9003) TaxID=240176 RepID=D6RM34_COPC7|nr:hypothetical protein CC1G_14423 [Coprinopsis cinerea okayama7\|eukprot:XP_002911426.1 hypothetical protein CC1G_14423 [Coprinopsis cinerea okayama7\
MAVSDLFVAIVRMHHITNPSKFRRLKRFALHANVSGLVKKGKPGLVVFDGSQSSVKTFLANARGLRYLEYHHVDTTSLPDKSKRVADGAPGLHEVEHVNTLVKAMDKVALKQWFRDNLGMAGPGR